MTTCGVPRLFCFDVKNGQLLNWSLQDPTTLLPILGATVSASLYYGRSATNPDATPGTVDPNFSNVPLVYVQNVTVPAPGQGTAAQYTGTILALFDPAANSTPTPYGGGYTLVVTMAAAGYQNQEWEIPANVGVRTD
jgi:hypothetical protein